MKIDTETLTVAVSLLESHTHTINLANIDINDACNNFIGMGEYIEELQRHYKEYEAIILKTINRLKQMSYFINNEVIKQYQNVENELDKVELYNAIKDLPKRDKAIIVYRYFRDMTQKEVASMLGVSQVQVSRLESKILSKLKEKIS